MSAQQSAGVMSQCLTAFQRQPFIQRLISLAAWDFAVWQRKVSNFAHTGRVTSLCLTAFERHTSHGAAPTAAAGFQHRASWCPREQGLQLRHSAQNGHHLTGNDAREGERTKTQKASHCSPLCADTNRGNTESGCEVCVRMLVLFPSCMLLWIISI